MTTPKEIRQWCETKYCPSWVGPLTKAEVLRLAWDHGHSAGANEVMFYYDEFMDVARAVIRDQKP